MSERKHGDSKNTKSREREIYCFRLYVAGSCPRSLRAIENTKKFCEEILKGQYDLEVIDMYQQPELLRGEQLVAAPTLIKYLPLPQCRFVGDLSRSEKILKGLNLNQTTSE